MKQMYVWAVSIGDRRVEVTAVDKFEASKLGARKLGVAWSRAARDLVILRLRKASTAAGRTYEAYF